MYRIGIIDLEKTEVLRELTNEFLMPSDYSFQVLSSSDDAEINRASLKKDFDILIDSKDVSIPELRPNSAAASFNSNNKELIKDLSETEKTELVKRELFFELRKLTGYSPLWGTLTGVRPVKLAGELINKYGRDNASELLLDYYLISEEKKNLIMNMYDYQIGSLGEPEERSISLYVGIPFCPTRCLYCSFASNQVPHSEVEIYIPALIKEIHAVSELVKDRGYRPESIYMGGGTPTTLTAKEMDYVLSEINNAFSGNSINGNGIKEFTVEAGRPDTIDLEKLKAIRDNGVNRISVNPQSMKAETLEIIGRLHTPSDIERAMEEALKVGFDSINCDLIAGLPGEVPEDMERSVKKVMTMGADNITVHNLAVKRASKLNESSPDYHYKYAETAANMIELARDILTSKGYNAYYLYRQKHMAGSGENTGYALPGKEGLYNVRIMDEHQTIIAMGAGGITKYYHKDENRLIRVPNVTNYTEYIDRIDEMIGRKKNAY